MSHVINTDFTVATTLSDTCWRSPNRPMLRMLRSAGLALILLATLPFSGLSRLALAQPSPTLATTLNADPAVFESEPAAAPTGGGHIILGTQIVAWSFRLTTPTHVSALGADLSTYDTTATAFLALYKLQTPYSHPDATGESDLLATTLVAPASSTGSDVSGPVSLDLQPGWYAIGVSTDRNGAATTGYALSMPSVSSGSTGMLGPYTVSTNTNVWGFQGTTPRLFVLGHGAAAAPPSNDFQMLTAAPWASWSQGSHTVNATDHLGTRFHVDTTVHVHRVAAWMSYGSGQVFAAIVRLPSLSAMPQPYGSTAFTNSLVGTTLINVGNDAADYAGDFGGLELIPGDYALLFGSGLFGASGTAALMSLENDGAIISDDTLWWNGSNTWYDYPSHYHMALFGTQAQLNVAPNPISFLPTMVGSSRDVTLEVSNTSDNAIQLGGLSLSGADASAFAINSGNCLSVPLAAHAQCHFTVSYAPQTHASHSADLRVTSNAQPDPLIIHLTGSSIGLAVQVDDGTDYAAYNQALDYTVKISNIETSTLSDIDVLANLPTQLDATQATWICTDPGSSGCTVSGVGDLADTGLSLTSGASVTYAIQAPVKAQATGPSVELSVSAASSSAGPYVGSDKDILVLFRDGFDAADSGDE